MIEYRMTGVLELAQADHEHILGLFVRLLEANAPTARRQLVATLAHELERHATTEAATLYAALRELPGAGDLLADAAAEHEEIREALDDLLATAPDDQTWGEVLATLRTCVEQHIDTEEGEIFAVAEELLDTERLLQLGDTFARMAREASAGSASLAGHPYMLGPALRIAVPYLRL
jgi:hypothetical protein